MMTLALRTSVLQLGDLVNESNGGEYIKHISTISYLPYIKPCDLTSLRYILMGSNCSPCPYLWSSTKSMVCIYKNAAYDLWVNTF